MLTHIKNNHANEIYTGERCHIVELLNDPNSPNISISRCRVEPGVTTQLHTLNDIGETYFIEQGEGIMDDGKSKSFAVAPGDHINIPPNHPQRIKNTGKTDLIFKVICTPSFTPDCYVDLES